MAEVVGIEETMIDEREKQAEQIKQEQNFQMMPQQIDDLARELSKIK